MLYYVYNSNKSNVYFRNNIFIGQYSFVNISYATFENNIFFGSNLASGLTNCVFNNNISYASSSQTLPPTNNSGNNNISDTNPLFVNAPPSFTTDITYSNITTYDFHLQSTSPCIGTGTGGTDMGIFGGSFPLRDLTGVSVELPYIKYVNISNPLVESNKSINVKIKAYKR